MAEQTVLCPNCGKRIPISKALADQVESELRKSFDAELKRREQEVKVAADKRYSAEISRLEKQIRREAKQEATVELAELRKELTEAQKREKTSKVDFERRVLEERKKLEQEAATELSELRQELTEAQRREKTSQADFEQRLEEEKKKLKQQSRKEAQAEVTSKMAELEKQLRGKDEEIEKAEEKRLEVQRLQFRLAAREKALETEVARKVSKAVEKAEEDVATRLGTKYQFRELQLEKKLNDARKRARELENKLEQSSQQAQGEVVEIALETALKNAFPEDEIEPIEKGQAGADVLQRVRTPNGQLCGAIIWETKNTKTWSKAWLSKLRGDQRRIKAELAVLISKALPKDVKHFAQVEGIWVAEYGLALGVATALRANLIQVAMLKQTVKGKHETLELLYEYLSSTEFRHRIEAMVEAFQGMRDDLNKERQTMEKQWAKREMQIHLVVQNVSGMYGDMQAIVGPALPKIRKLELPEPQSIS